MSRGVTVRIDDGLKQQAEEMLEEIGLSMTAYFTTSLKALIREKKIPFELSTKAKANAEYLEKLDQSIAQAERGEVVRYTKEQRRSLGAK